LHACSHVHVHLLHMHVRATLPNSRDLIARSVTAWERLLPPTAIVACTPVPAHALNGPSLWRRLLVRNPTASLNSLTLSPSHISAAASPPRRNTALRQPVYSSARASCTLPFPSLVSFTAVLYTSFLPYARTAACLSACCDPVTRTTWKSALLLPACLPAPPSTGLVWSHSPPNHTTTAPDQHTQARVNLSAAAGPSHHVRLRRARA